MSSNFAQATPNPAFEPTRNDWSPQALISFWAFRSQPLLAAQLDRCEEVSWTTTSNKYRMSCSRS